MEVKFGVIDTDNFSCHGYYITRFSSYPYTLQPDLSIDGQFIYFVEMIFEGTYLFPTNVNSRYYDLQRTKSINTIVSLRKIINSNVNVICYYSKYVLPP